MLGGPGQQGDSELTAGIYRAIVDAGVKAVRIVANPGGRLVFPSTAAIEQKYPLPEDAYWGRDLLGEFHQAAGSTDIKLIAWLEGYATAYRDSLFVRRFPDTVVSEPNWAGNVRLDLFHPAFELNFLHSLRDLVSKPEVTGIELCDHFSISEQMLSLITRNHAQEIKSSDLSAAVWLRERLTEQLRLVRQIVSGEHGKAVLVSLNTFKYARLTHQDIDYWVREKLVDGVNVQLYRDRKHFRRSLQDTLDEVQRNPHLSRIKNGEIGLSIGLAAKVNNVYLSEPDIQDQLQAVRGAVLTGDQGQKTPPGTVGFHFGGWPGFWKSQYPRNASQAL